MNAAPSPREVEVIRLIADGRPPKQVARDLGMSHHTVKDHLDALRRKLGAANTTHAVALALRSGVLQ